MPEKKDTKAFTDAVGCCPDFMKVPVCDILDMRYRLPFGRLAVGKPFSVNVVLHFRLERCSLGLTLGDPVYSITLLPGEQVRLFTSDRHTRWSYDSETSMTYRHATTSAESFYAAGMAQAMSDLTINESGSGSSSCSESWSEGGGGAFFGIPGLFGVGGGGGGGSYDASSVYEFSRSLSRHAECSSSYVAATVRSKSAVSIGEVERRAHAEGESEAQYESSSRIFSNPNKCRAVTYFFYQINKVQVIRFSLMMIERWVEDPTAPTGAYLRVPVDIGKRVTVLPQAVLATSDNRLKVEENVRKSVLAHRQEAMAEAGITPSAVSYSGMRLATPVTATPITVGPMVSLEATDRSGDRQSLLDKLNAELVGKKILDEKTMEPSERIKKVVSWEKQEILPTPGVLVKGCLDNCDTCEPGLQKEIELDLERKRLDNEMQKRQTELLDKAQEYRCCPGGTSEEPSDE